MNLKISKYKNYLLNLILIWITYLLYKTNSYYMNFIRQETIATLFYLGLAYTIIGFFYYLFTKSSKIKISKGSLIFNAIKKIFKTKSFKIEKQEKTALLFVIVKIFFLPIMLNFFFANYNSIKNQLLNIDSFSALFTINSFNFIIFPLLLAALFLIDTLWFSFGYIFESKFLGNSIKSVEPTFLGWFVALACYPPFNSILTKQIGWFANDYLMLPNNTLMFIIRLLAILLLTIYVGATLALGTKCSNLTNRGIVSRGPYSIVRHPAYISKNLAWWITIIPILSIPAFLSMATWSFIYHLRALTEERHLKQDPDYIEYCKKVKYKYIPGIY